MYDSSIETCCGGEVMSVYLSYKWPPFLAFTVLEYIPSNSHPLWQMLLM